MKTAIATLAWLLGSIFVSELFGYLLHRLLHSGRIGFLSRSHMRHHLVLYGPLEAQRPGPDYHDSTSDAIALGNVGLEWLIPGALLLATSILILNWLRITFFHQALFVGGTLTWSFLMFSYLHDRMHMAGFWMERNRWLNKWFLAARDAHDIHHWALNDKGLMDKNFGIAFYLFDRLFGTLAKDWPAFNQRGYASALERFGNLLESAHSSAGSEHGQKKSLTGSRNFALRDLLVAVFCGIRGGKKWDQNAEEECFH
jgi:sterol desaturase/sphingolipid hydroxylase (fatty acid hydroxylase superfamily)